MLLNHSLITVLGPKASPSTRCCNCCGDNLKIAVRLVLLKEIYRTLPAEHPKTEFCQVGGSVPEALQSADGLGKYGHSTDTGILATD